MKLPTYISILLLAISLVNCKKDAPEILDLPQIDNFSLREDTVGAVVTILGKNFSETSSNNIVIFNSAQANPFYSRRDTLKVKVPNGASTGTIQVKVYSKLCVSKDTFFVLTGKWTKMADCPEGGRFDAVGFSVGNIGYISNGTGYDKERTAAAGFVINGKGYIAGGGPGPLQGFVDLWEYDASVDKWTRKADMKPIGYEGIGFSVKGKGYVGNTNWAYKQLWEYDPSKNKWTKKKNFPGIAVSGCVSFVIDDIAYVATGVLSNNVSSEIWKFEPE